MKNATFWFSLLCFLATSTNTYSMEEHEHEQSSSSRHPVSALYTMLMYARDIANTALMHSTKPAILFVEVKEMLLQRLKIHNIYINERVTKYHREDKETLFEIWNTCVYEAPFDTCTTPESLYAEATRRSKLMEDTINELIEEEEDDDCDSESD